MTAEITRATIADQAYASLKAQIVTGELPAGLRLLPNALAAKLQVSPTPVKEALLRLERDGLVETEARRGVVVRRFRQAELAELYGVRALIEMHAVRVAFAANRVDAELVQALETEQTGLLKALGGRTAAGLAEALRFDRALHGRLVNLTGNTLMVAWHAQVMTQTHTVRIYTPATYTPELLRAEHGAIIAALRAGDEDATLAALDQHLGRSQLDLMQRAAAMAGPDGAAA